MNFKWIDKFLLVLLLLLTIALAALCIGTAMSFVTGDMLGNAVSVMTNGLLGNKLILGGAGLVLLIVAFRLFIAMGKRQQGNAAPQAQKPVATLIHAGDDGAAYISLAAIDSMVQRHCRANPKVKECESNITAAEQGITIGLRLAVSNETVLPELTAGLQASLKEYIQAYCGITVRDVDILIIAAPAPAKTPRVM